MAGGGATLARLELRSGVVAIVARDGSVTVTRGDPPSSSPVVTIEPPAVGPAWRDEGGGASFAAVLSEGDAGGERGLSPRADDDGDGAFDEDRADGRDNDGDGRVDEDFAAIGEEMVVVERSMPMEDLRLESYHWSYPHVAAALFLNWERSGGAPGAEPAVVLVARGSNWLEMELEGASPAAVFVTRVPEEAGSSPLWFGASRLGLLAGSREGPAARLEAESLELPLSAGRLCVAVAVAPTLLQLRSLLARAHSVYTGAPGRPGGPNVPWIVPALRPAAREVEHISAAWRAGEGPGAWDLVFTATPGACLLIDPDWLLVGGRHLGSPIEISWRARPPGGELGETKTGRAWRREWNGPPARALHELSPADIDPYAGSPLSCGHAEAGELSFKFPAPFEPAGGTLTVPLLSGRTVELTLPAPVAQSAAGGGLWDVGDTGGGLAVDASGQPQHAARAVSLAPWLLENYPNPFRNVTRVRFSVPLTIGEGLVDRDGATPSQLDAQMAIPYRTSPPLVSLKIYSVGGQEIADLYHGNLLAGDHSAVWDGTDLQGRPVASGTYFCKLQIECWSVTKTIVFLR